MVALRKYSPGRPPLPTRNGGGADIAGVDAIRADIRKRISSPGSSKQVAHDLGVSRGHLVAVANGNQRPGPALAQKLGYQLAWERVLVEQANAEDQALADKIEAELHGPSLLREDDEGSGW